MDFSNLLTSLEIVRYGMLMEGGGSVVYPLCIFRSWADVAWFSPKAVCIGLMAPFPPDWIMAGTLGHGVRILGAVETLAIYILLPYVLIGIGQMWKRA